MKQTPAHDRHNPDVLRLMPKNLKRVVEVGCSSGALARAYMAENPVCEYTGIEIDPEYAERAKASCGSVICADVESMSEEVFLSLFPSDCWVFGDSLESTGYHIVEGHSRVADEPARQNVMPSIRAMAVATGSDPQVAENDSLALQYVVKEAAA